MTTVLTTEEKVTEILNEELITLESLHAEMENLVPLYNELQQGEGNLRTVLALDTKMRDYMKKYQKLREYEVFEELSKHEKPLLQAVRQLSYETIAFKDKVIKDTTIPVREIVDKTVQIDLGKLHKFVDGGIGEDKNWIYSLEKFNFLLTAKVARDLDAKASLTEINDSYHMRKLSREVDLGTTKLSKNNISKTLNAVIMEMLGKEYKSSSHDVLYLENAMTVDLRSVAGLKVGNDRRLRNVVLKTLNRIVTGKDYVVTSNQVRKK